jgi:hypothetical protein
LLFSGALMRPEAPDSDGGAIQNFIRSLYSGRFYASVPLLPLKVGFRNMLLLAAILGLVTATTWGTTISRGIAEWERRVTDGSMPSLYLKNGRLSVSGGPQPFVQDGVAGGVLIIDTTGVYSGVPDSVDQGIFVGRDRAEHKTAPNISRTYDFRGQKVAMNFDARGVRALRRSAFPTVLLIGGFLAFIYYFAGNTLLALPLAGMGLFLTRTFMPMVRLRYAQVLTVMLFVLTPVSLLFRFMGLVQPDIARKLLPFYPALAASLLLAALRASLVPRDPAPPEN